MSLRLAALALVAGCVAPGFANTGPQIRSSAEDIGVMPTRASTRKALAVIDARLRSVGLVDASPALRVTWLPVVSFVEDERRDRSFLGLTEVVLHADGFWCDALVSTHYQDRVSLTALTHEALHCSLARSMAALDGDREHRRPEWGPCGRDRNPGCGWLDDTDAMLHAAGL